MKNLKKRSKNELIDVIEKLLEVHPESIHLLSSKPSEKTSKNETIKRIEKEAQHHVSSVLKAYQNADFIIISTPTNDDSKLTYLDASSVENAISDVLEHNPNAVMII